MQMIKHISLLAGALFACHPAARAIDVDAGDYSVAPGGTNVFLLYGQHATRDSSYTNGTHNTGEPRLKSDVGILRAVRYIDVGDYVVAPQVLLPFGKLSASGSIAALGSNSGVGDVILAAPLWFNKAGAKQQYALTPYLILPTGQYDRNQPLSLGENRWRFALQAGTVQTLTDKLSLDLVGDIQFHGKNDEYGTTGATRKQKPLYEMQTFLKYAIAPGADLRVGLQHYAGGEYKVDGVDQGDRQSTTRIQFGGSMFLTSTTQLTATYGRDLSVRSGFQEAHRVNLRLLQVF